MPKSARLVMVLVLCIACVVSCDGPVADPAYLPQVPLLKLRREGGIAGFHDWLAVGHGGEYYLQLGSATILMGTLPKERRVQLEAWHSDFGPFVLWLEDNPGMPDNLVRELTWMGQGRLQATEAQERELMDWAEGLLTTLSTSER